MDTKNAFAVVAGTVDYDTKVVPLLLVSPAGQILPARFQYDEPEPGVYVGRVVTGCDCATCQREPEAIPADNVVEAAHICASRLITAKVREAIKDGGGDPDDLKVHVTGLDGTPRHYDDATLH